MGKRTDQTDAENVKSLFPLPLSDIEQMHWLQDAPLTPNIICCHLKLKGKLDRDICDEVIWQGTSTRHVLLSANLSGGGSVKPTGRAAWVSLPQARRQLQAAVAWHHTAYDPHRFQPPPIDLSQHVPIRCDIFQHFDSASQCWTDMLWQIHHAASDGVGGMQLINEFLVAYHNLAQGQPYGRGLRDVDHRRLASRNRLGLFSAGFLKRLPVQWIPVYGVCKFAFSKIAPLLPAAEGESTRELPPDKPLHAPNETTFARYRGASFSRSIVRGLRNRAADEQATTNELLLAALFRATDRWQRRLEFDRGRRKIRLMVPINLREISDRRLPACNRMSFVQLDRGDRDLADISDLIRGIHYELGIIRKYQFARVPNLVLRGLLKMPGDKARMLRNHFRATTLLSNIGWPQQKLKLPRSSDGYLQPADLQLNQVNLIAPYYQLCPVTFLVSGYAGQLNVTLNYNPRRLTRQQAEDYLSEFARQVEHLVPPAKSQNVGETTSD